MLRQFDARDLLRLRKVSKYFRFKLRIMTQRNGVLYASILNLFPEIKDLSIGFKDWNGNLVLWENTEWLHYRMPLLWFIDFRLNKWTYKAWWQLKAVLNHAPLVCIEVFNKTCIPIISLSDYWHESVQSHHIHDLIQTFVHTRGMWLVILLNFNLKHLTISPRLPRKHGIGSLN